MNRFVLTLYIILVFLGLFVSCQPQNDVACSPIVYKYLNHYFNSCIDTAFSDKSANGDIFNFVYNSTNDSLNVKINETDRSIKSEIALKFNRGQIVEQRKQFFYKSKKVQIIRQTENNQIETIKLNKEGTMISWEYARQLNEIEDTIFGLKFKDDIITQYRGFPYEFVSGNLNYVELLLICPDNYSNSVYLKDSIIHKTLKSDTVRLMYNKGITNSYSDNLNFKICLESLINSDEKCFITGEFLTAF